MQGMMQMLDVDGRMMVLMMMHNTSARNSSSVTRQM
jgi:hypothetical protein